MAYVRSLAPDRALPMPEDFGWWICHLPYYLFPCAAAFLLLRIDYALLLAALTAVIDALPVLGTGVVLIPWAVYDLLTGATARAIGLAVTYAAVTLLRQSIQAKLLGDQLGLHPLATLVSIYVGWRTCGVWGMLLFPILAITGKQLLDSGVLRPGNII